MATEIPESPVAVDIEEPQGTHGHRERFSVDADEPIDDVLDVEMEQFFQKKIPAYEYNSTFSLVNWARTIRKGEGLSNDTLNRLFNEVLLHPNFKVEDLSVRSAYDIEKYESSLYNEADGWKTESIDGLVLRYHDPLIALESLFSCPSLAENFTVLPTFEVIDLELREYSTPSIGNWWRSMQGFFFTNHNAFTRFLM